MTTRGNQVEQRVKLDTAQYTSQFRKMTSDVKAGVGSINRDVQSAGTSFQDYAQLVKAQGSQVTKQFSDVGKAFAKNMGKGAVTLAAVSGFSAFERSVRSSAQVGLDFGKALAQMGSRADLTADKLAKLRKRFYDLGSRTGASLPSLPAAGASLLGAVGGNADKAMAILDPIARAAGAENGDAATLTEQVKGILKGEGRDLNVQNVQGLLQSGFLAKSGGDFASMDEYLQARLQGVQGVAGRAHLSDREQAAYLAAATQVGQDKEASVSGLQALIRQSVTGLGGGAALAGLMGVHGGFLTNGKFDISKLGQASASLKARGMGEADYVRLLSSGGLSEKESQGVYALLSGNGDFQKRVKSIQGNNKSFDQSVAESTDDMSDGFKKLQNAIVEGTDQIFSPMGNVIKKALKGDTMGTLDAIPSAITGSMKGLWDNKGLVAGGMALSAMSGMLSSKLGLFGGVMMGNKLKDEGVEPVYVVNASEIRGEETGSSADSFFKKTAAIMAGGGVAEGAAEGAGGWLSGILSGTAGTALGVGAAGAAAYEVGANTPAILDKLDQLLDYLSGKGGNSSIDPNFPMPAREVKLTLESKAPGFVMKPQAADKATNPRGP